MQSRLSRRWIYLLAVSAITAAPALGNTFTWNVGNGSFGIAGNWTPGGGPPIAGDTAQFTSAATYTTTFSLSPTNATLDMTGGDVTFVALTSPRIYTVTSAVIHGGDLTLVDAVQPMQLTATSLSVFNGSTLSIEDGNVVSTATFSVGATSPASLVAKVLVDGSSASLSVSGLTNLGQNGATGNLTLQNSASASFANMQTTNSANALSGSNVLIQSGATATSSGSLSLGITGVLGQASTFTLTGSNSAFTQSGATTITLGSSANSSSALDIKSSGIFTTGTGLLTINQTGTLTVAGGTLNANGNITVNGGILQHTSGGFNWAVGKTMTVQNGGHATITAAYVTPTSATINVTGAGSQLNVTTATNFSIKGGAQVSVSLGGSISSSGLLHIGTSTAGSAIIDGLNSSIAASGGTESFVGVTNTTGTLTVRNSASASFPGGLTIAAVGGAGTVNVESGATATIGSMHIGVSANAGTVGNLNVSGGVVTMPGASSFILGGGSISTGNISITSGSFTSGTGASTVGTTGVLAVTGGTFVAQGNIFFNTGGTLTIGGAPDNWTGNFDLRASKLIFKATAGTKAGLIATLVNQVNYGKTHSAGITSSALPADTAIAVIDNGALLTPFGTFGGTPVNTDAVFVAPELLGDANVDGVVNFSDFVVLSNNFGAANSGWAGGDFDGNGTTNFTDFVQLSNHFGQTFGNSSNLVVGADELAAFHAASEVFLEATAVPEPALGMLLPAGMAALALRRRGSVRN